MFALESRPQLTAFPCRLLSLVLNIFSFTQYTNVPFHSTVLLSFKVASIDQIIKSGNN
jgi:hypothetical protein